MRYRPDGGFQTPGRREGKQFKEDERSRTSGDRPSPVEAGGLRSPAAEPQRLEIGNRPRARPGRLESVPDSVAQGLRRGRPAPGPAEKTSAAAAPDSPSPSSPAGSATPLSSSSAPRRPVQFELPLARLRPKPAPKSIFGSCFGGPTPPPPTSRPPPVGQTPPPPRPGPVLAKTPSTKAAAAQVDLNPPAGEKRPPDPPASTPAGSDSNAPAEAPPGTAPRSSSCRCSALSTGESSKLPAAEGGDSLMSNARGNQSGASGPPPPTAALNPPAADIIAAVQRADSPRHARPDSHSPIRGLRPNRHRPEWPAPAEQDDDIDGRAGSPGSPDDAPRPPPRPIDNTYLVDPRPADDDAPSPADPAMGVARLFDTILGRRESYPPPPPPRPHQERSNPRPPRPSPERPPRCRYNPRGMNDEQFQRTSPEDNDEEDQFQRMSPMDGDRFHAMSPMANDDEDEDEHFQRMSPMNPGDQFQATSPVPMNYGDQFLNLSPTNYGDQFQRTSPMNTGDLPQRTSPMNYDVQIQRSSPMSHGERPQRTSPMNIDRFQIPDERVQRMGPVNDGYQFQGMGSPEQEEDPRNYSPRRWRPPPPSPSDPDRGFRNSEFPDVLMCEADSDYSSGSADERQREEPGPSAPPPPPPPRRANPSDSSDSPPSSSSSEEDEDEGEEGDGEDGEDGRNGRNGGDGEREREYVWKKKDPYREMKWHDPPREVRRRGQPDPTFQPRPGDIILRARKRARLRLIEFFYYDDENYLEAGDQVLRAKFEYLPPLDTMWLWCKLYVFDGHSSYTFLDQASEVVNQFKIEPDVRTFQPPAAFLT